MLENDEEFLTYVDRITKKMRSYSRLGAGKEVSFYELEQVLAEYANVWWELSALITEARVSLQHEKEDFENWFGEEFIKIRARVNTPDLSAQKWMGAKEIEYMIRMEQKHPYMTKRTILTEMEQRYEYLCNIQKGWEKFNFTLHNLSNNVRSELGLDNMAGRLTR